MIIFLIFFLSLFSFIFIKKELLIIFKKNFWYLIISFFIFFLILFPWIREVSKIIYSNRLDQPKNWNDITAFSADLTNLLIPVHGLFYKKITDYLAVNFLYISRIFENFTYPGLIILITLIGYLFVTKKLPKQLKPIFYSSLAFLILTLGPFLQILGNNLKVPLPYIFITYIPFFNMARSPGRFIVPFIFLSSVIASFVIQFFLKKVTKNGHRLIIITVFFLIFFVDQLSFISKAPSIKLPQKIYQYLSKQRLDGVVLEVPFSIRDSIKNFGYIHAHWLPFASLIHKQKIFSTYTGRIPNSIFNYYLNNPLIEPLGKIADLENKDFKKIIEKINRENFINGLDFYGINYSINKDDEAYSDYIETFFKEVGFKKIITDGNYSLLQRQVKTITIDEINFDSSFDSFSLADGWGEKESQDRSRWAMTETAQFFLKLQKVEDKIFIIDGEAIVKPQIVKIFINDQYAGKMTFQTGKYNKQSLKIKDRLLNQGLNKITLRFKNNHVLKDILPGSADIRPLSLHIKYVGLK